jgi:DNA-binding response OmpR family regulator
MKKVLIVEDSLPIVNVLRILLQNEGIQVENTSKGREVAAMAKKSKYDLIILDLMMPSYSGKDVFADLKSDASTAKIPILILTAKADALRWNSELASCDKFMTKPFDNAELVSEVKRLIR